MKSIILLVCSTIFALLLAEGAVRLFSPVELRIMGDQIILPRLKRYEISFEGAKRLEPHVLNSRNSLGFRGPEPRPDMSDVLSIVAVGGSTTECFALAEDRDWPSVLGRLLSANFRDAWVNNAGLNGHTTRGHLLLLEQYLMELKPKVILFLIGLNDANFPYNSKTFDERILDESRQGFISRGFQKSRRWLLNHSHALALVVQTYRQMRAKEWGFVASEYEVDFRKVAETGNTPTAAQRARELETLVKADYYGFESRVRKLVELTHSIDAIPVFMTQPGLAGDAVDDATNLDLSKLIDSMAIRTELVNRRLIELSRELDFFVIDLASQMPKSTNLYYDLWHFSNAGAEVVAEISYRSLCPYLAEQFPEQVIAPCAVSAPMVFRDPGAPLSLAY